MATRKKNIEPESIGPENPNGDHVNEVDAARQAIANDQARKRKHQPYIDRAVEWIKAQEATLNRSAEFEVRDLLTAAYELPKANSEAVAGFLKQVKMDGRLEISSAGMDTMISLAPAVIEEAEPIVAAEKLADHSGEAAISITIDRNGDSQLESISLVSESAETKTVEQHLAEAKGRQTRLPFPHNVGTWVFSPYGPARITGMQTTGDITMYQVKSESGTTFRDVPAWNLGELPGNELARIQDHESLLKLRKHNEAGAQLAQFLADAQAKEVEQSQELKATRKYIEKLRESIDAHLCGVPQDGQQEIDLEGDEGTAEIKGAAEPQAPIPPDTSTAQERLVARLTGRDSIELPDASPVWAALDAATLKGADSTGKPPKIVPLVIEQAPGNWICVDVQNGVAVLLPALKREDWRAKYLERFDAPRDIPSQAMTAKQEAGGTWTGFPVKHGRATLFLAPLDDALLLRLPAQAAKA